MPLSLPRHKSHKGGGVYQGIDDDADPKLLWRQPVVLRWLSWGEHVCGYPPQVALPLMICFPQPADRSCCGDCLCCSEFGDAGMCFSPVIAPCPLWRSCLGVVGRVRLPLPWSQRGFLYRKGSLHKGGVYLEVSNALGLVAVRSELLALPRSPPPLITKRSHALVIRHQQRPPLCT